MPLTRWLRTVFAVDRAATLPGAGLRAAVGVVLPLLVGVAAGDPTTGAIAAAGAIPAGVAGLGRPRAAAVRVTAATAVGMALSTGVGTLVAGHTPALVAVLALWGALAGIAAAQGPVGTVVGVQAVIGLVVFGHYPGGVTAAAGHAAAVAAGALGQALLAGLLPPLRRFTPTRQALARVADSLATLAGGDAPGATGAAVDALLAARTVLSTGPGALVLDELSALRLELVALRAQRTGRAGEVRAALALDLAVLARSWRRGQVAAVPSTETVTAVAAAAAVRAAAPPGPAGTPVRVVAARAAAAERQLRSLRARSADVLAGGPRPGRSGGRPRWRLVRPGAGLARHTARLAVVLPLTAAVGASLPGGHGYWVPLTAVIVLRPDYVGTVSRGVGRVAGTLVGVLLGGGVALGLHPRGALLVVLTLLCAWAAFAVFPAGAAAYAVALTAVIVLLLATRGPHPAQLLADRALDTVLGGGIALASYRAWPTGEGSVLPAATAELLRAVGGYAAAVLGALAGGGAAPVAPLRAAAGRARAARVDLTAAVERVSGEPGRDPDRDAAVRRATTALAATRPVMLAMHGLRAAAQDSPTSVAVPDAALLGADLQAALGVLATRVLGGAGADPSAALLRWRARLAATVDATADPASPLGRRQALLLVSVEPVLVAVAELGAALTSPAQPAGR